MADGRDGIIYALFKSPHGDSHDADAKRAHVSVAGVIMNSIVHAAVEFNYE